MRWTICTDGNGPGRLTGRLWPWQRMLSAMQSGSESK
nr:MAG TPA: hypothetical protein [Caudoviricetes sp.]